MAATAGRGLLTALLLGCGTGDTPDATPAAGVSTPQEVILTTPDAVFAQGFSNLVAVHELADRRVLALDGAERTIRRIDLGSGSAELIGRRGSGPGEYSLPTALLPMPGDSVAVLDMARRRLLMLAPEGTPAGVISLEFPFTHGDDAFGSLRSDMQGTLYVSGREFAMSPSGIDKFDSIPIIRWRIGAPSADTLAWFRRQDVSITGSREGKDQNISFRRTPFTGRDVWTVGLEGRVIVAQPENFELRWTEAASDPAAEGRGNTVTLPFDPLPLSEAHKEEWRATQRGRSRTIIGEDGNATVLPAEDREPVDPPSWPESLPPFLPGALHVDRNGNIWVQRTTEAGAAPHYDVIDSTGAFVRQVRLPTGSRILGFGAGNTIYVAHTDADDVQHLQRFRGVP